MSSTWTRSPRSSWRASSSGVIWSGAGDLVVEASIGAVVSRTLVKNATVSNPGALPFPDAAMYCERVHKQIDRDDSGRIEAMRLTRMCALLVLGALACGKKSGEAQAQQAPAADPAAAAPATAAPAGPVVEVKMTGVGQKFGFEPATLTVAPGATVRFINVSGGPHNVSFWAESGPA